MWFSNGYRHALLRYLIEYCRRRLSSNLIQMFFEPLSLIFGGGRGWEGRRALYCNSVCCAWLRITFLLSFFVNLKILASHFFKDNRQDRVTGLCVVLKHAKIVHKSCNQYITLYAVVVQHTRQRPGPTYMQVVCVYLSLPPQVGFPQYTARGRGYFVEG